MGKRKTKRKAPPKRKTQKLDKEFNCPICFADKTVEVHLNHKAGVANALCRACRNQYEISIASIDAEIDVFAAWVDAVEDGTAPGVQQSVLAEDLVAIPQSRKVPTQPGKRLRVENTHQYVEDGEADDDERYLGDPDDDDDVDDIQGFGRPATPPLRHAPIEEDIEEEIELPEEEEEYDFGDDDDEGGGGGTAGGEDDSGGLPSAPQSEEEQHPSDVDDAAAAEPEPTWDD